eukprot:2603460-Alexandrium_andersonii.AAC.1
MEHRVWNRLAINDAFANIGYLGTRVPRPEEVGADGPGTAAAFCMEPPSIQRVVTMALAQISGVARVEDGGAMSETEPGGEESPGSSASEVSDSRRER